MASIDYQGVRSEPVLPRANIEHFNLIASFRDAATAQQAVTELRRLGFDDQDAGVLGTTSDVVNPDTGVSEPEARVARSLFRDAAIGMVAGAIVGALIGVGLLAIPAVQSAVGAHVSAGGYIPAAIVGALIGLTFGGLVGGIAGLDRRQAGSRTYELNGMTGDTLVGVRADGEPRRQTARTVLRQAGATSVQDNTPSRRRAG